MFCFQAMHKEDVIECRKPVLKVDIVCILARFSQTRVAVICVRKRGLVGRATIRWKKYSSLDNEYPGSGQKWH